MLEENDPLIDDITRELRAPVAADPAARVRIMAAVYQAPPPSRRTTRWGWLVRPRTIRISPLGGLAAVSVAAAAIFAIVAIRGSTSTKTTGPAIASVPALETLPADYRPIQFVLVAPSAAQVAIVGDFNDWDVGATPLREETRDGLWSVVIPLRAGRHQYAFVVDGNRWLADPSAPRAADDDFGSPSSVITVGEKRT